jgi:molybdopterin molybdotransferase
MQVTHLDPISAAIARALEHLSPVASEQLPIQDSCGRILAEPLVADRDSPPTNVSAMDGYAVRLQDVPEEPQAGGALRVSATCSAGHPPAELPPGEAVQIFTGAPLPSMADCVVRREDCQETSGQVRFLLPREKFRPGQNIRYQGENIGAGAEVLAAGTELGTASIAGLATFGARMVSVRRQVRVGVLTSGDELVAPGEPAQAWQIRNSNSMVLRGWISKMPWVYPQTLSNVGDSLEATRESLQQATQQADAVILTGGVSAGDTDFVLPAIESLGGTVVFHRLPLRPGKPVLVAMLQGKLVAALPGNPVSAAVTARVIAEPLLDRLAGRNSPPRLRLNLSHADSKTLNLFWYRLIRLGPQGAELVGSQGSGDLVSLARSHGFVELPPGESGAGPWRTWLW